MSAEPEQGWTRRQAAYSLPPLLGFLAATVMHDATAPTEALLPWWTGGTLVGAGLSAAIWAFRWWFGLDRHSVDD